MVGPTRTAAETSRGWHGARINWVQCRCRGGATPGIGRSPASIGYSDDRDKAPGASAHTLTENVASQMWAAATTPLDGMTAMSSNSWKKKARQQQKATGSSYLRARRHVNNDSSEPTGPVPGSAGAAKLLSLMGLDTAGTPDVTALWSQHDVLGSIPIGLQAGGSPVRLDLNDYLAGGNGPNGLVVGTAGSGKSTLLQSMLFALCAQHSPEQLQLMRIGSTERSVFDDFAEYPHVVKTSGWKDPKTVLNELVDERAGMPNHEPELVVVVDEVFADDYRLEYRIGLGATLSSMMRHARALGIHVLMSAQTLPPTSALQLTAGADYRIALRTSTAQDSRDLIGSTRANELPPSAGLGLFRPSPSADPVPFRAFQVPPDLVRGVGRQLATASGNG